MAGPSDAGLSPCPPSSSAGLWLPTMARSFRQLHRAPAHPDRSAGAEFSRCALLLGTSGLIVCESTVGVSHFGGDAVRGRTASFKGRLGPRPLLAAGEYACVSPAATGRSGPAIAARQQALARFKRCLLPGRGRSGALCAVVASALLPTRRLRLDRSQAKFWGPEPASRDSLSSPRLGRPRCSSAMRRPSVLPRGFPLGSCMASGLFCTPLPSRPGHP